MIYDPSERADFWIGRSAIFTRFLVQFAFMAFWMVGYLLVLPAEYGGTAALAGLLLWVCAIFAVWARCEAASCLEWACRWSDLIRG